MAANDQRVLICRGSKDQVDEFASKEDVRDWVQARLEDALERMDINIFVGGIPHKVRLKVSVIRGWNPCADCMCCFEEDEGEE